MLNIETKYRIELEINRQREKLKATQREFDLFDNTEDMHMIDNIEYAIEVLEGMIA